MSEQSGMGSISVLPGTTPAVTRSHPPLKSDLTLGPVALVAAASAIAAAFASGAPTAFSPANLVFRAAIGALVVLAGVVAPWPLLFLGAVGALVGATGTAAVVPAGAAVGLSIANPLAHRRIGGNDSSAARTWPARAIAAALVIQVDLRLSWPHTSLATAVLGTVSVFLILAGGVIGSPRQIRRTGAIVVSALAVLALVVVGLSAWSMLSVRNSLAAAVLETRHGLHAAEQGDRRAAVADFQQAHGSFRSSYDQLDFAIGGELIPILAPQIEAVRVATSIGTVATQAAIATAREVDLASLHVKHGVVPIAAIARLAAPLAHDQSVLQSAVTETQALSSPWLLTVVTSRLSEELSRLHVAERDTALAALAARELPAMLGGVDPRHYLVLFENPAESRASGGVIGDYAIVTALGGGLHLEKVGAVAQLNSGGNRERRTLIAPADYVARYGHFQPQYNWENVPMSPDFPSVAKVAAALYPQSGGSPVDGVFSVDPFTLSRILAITGPVTVHPWPVPITSANVQGVLELGEFVHFGVHNAARVHFVQAVIRQVWHELTTRQLPPMTKVVKDLAPAAGHLLMYSPNPAQEQVFDGAKISGVFPPVNGDFLGITTQNAVGSKIDWFLHRSIGYHAVLDPLTGRITATVTLTLTNESPNHGLPGVVIDPAPEVPLPPGEDELYVSIYTPWQEDRATLAGRRIFLPQQTELGRYVYSALVAVPSESSRTLVLHLSGHYGEGEYHLTQYHQPTINRDVDHVSLQVNP